MEKPLAQAVRDIATPLPVIGWREWIALPDLGVEAMKVKVDSGARTSSLHAFEIERYRARGRDRVRFQVHPQQRKSKLVIASSALLLDVRHVKSSNGAVSERMVISTRISLLDQTFPIELSLSSRDEMGFRMLLGREAIRGRFLVDAARSYCDSSRRPAKSGRPHRKRRR